MCHPVPLSLMICDHIWRDPRTGKLALLGVFSAFASPVFPSPLTVTFYFALTDGSGILPVRVELTDLDEVGPTLCRAEGFFRFDDRRNVVEGAFECNVQIAEPGEYRVKLFVGDEFIMERSLMAMEIGQPDGANSP